MTDDAKSGLEGGSGSAPTHWRERGATQGCLRAHRTMPSLTLLGSLALLLLLANPLGAMPSAPFFESGTHPVSSAPMATVPIRLAVHPAGGAPTSTANASFWENTTVGGGNPVNYSQIFCNIYYPGYYCFPQAAQPSVLALPNGQIGYAFESLTNFTTSECPLALNNSTEIQVEFTLSVNGGRSFGAPVDLGNTSCPYFQSLEPSFAVGPSGSIDGAFVEANASPAEMNCVPACGPFWGQAEWYAPRVDDALAFVRSTNDGSSFSAVRTIQIAGVGGIADPSIAVHGNTIYVAYMNINNTTTGATLGDSSASPIASDLVYSTDDGADWSGPYTLPGYNATEYYNAMNPQVAVGPTGVVYVAYSSDRHCIAYCNYTSQEYGDNIYLATSSSNGTAWSAHVVASNYADGEELGQNPDALGWGNGATSGPWIFEEGPAIVLAVDPSSSEIYVAWTGAINESYHLYCGPPDFTFSYYCIYSSWEQSVLTVAQSSDGGSTWVNATISHDEDQTQQGQPDGEFLPAIAIAPSGTLYVTYATMNGTYTANGCDQEGSYQDHYFQGQWVMSSTNGVSWTQPDLVAWDYNGEGGWWLTGWTSSIAFNVTTGAPLLGYTLTEPNNGVLYGPYQEYTFPGYVQLAQPWYGPVTNLTIRATGLPAGTPWSVWVLGNVLSSTAANLTIANAPLHEDLWIQTGLPPYSPAYGEAYLANLSLPVDDDGFTAVPPFLNLTGPGQFYLNYSLFYLLNLSLNPASLEGYGVSYYIYDPGQNYAQWDDIQNDAFVDGCPMPWYVRAGTSLFLTGFRGNGYLPSNELYYSDNFAGPIGYFNGTGGGSYTGPGPNITIRLNGPINETGWVSTFGVYNVSVFAEGLPAASPVHFDWNSGAYSFSAPGPYILHNVSTGTYPISNIWAGASTSGYEYFGTSLQGSPVAEPNEPNVDLSFAYVDIAASVGVVSFHATGTTNGTTWQFEFNGTTYQSSTPWINVSTRPGTFAVAGYPIVSQNGTASFAPVGLASTMSVATGQTYPVNYSIAYEVSIAPAVGGSIAPASTQTWLAEGSSDSFTATPSNGYSFGGWTGKGPGSYTGPSTVANVTALGAITETPLFIPIPENHYALTFTSSGLPGGVAWSVYVDGVAHSTNSTVLTVPDLYSCSSGSIGHYTISIPYVYLNGSAPTRYVPGNYPATLCGGSGAVATGFSPQYFVQLENTTGGSVNAVPAGSTPPFDTSSWLAPSTLVTLTASASPGYLFDGWTGSGPGSYNGSLNPETQTVYGSVSELATFTHQSAPVPTTYVVEFQTSSTPPTGITWTVDFNGTPYSSSTGNLSIAVDAPGRYDVSTPTVYSPNDATEWTPSGTPTTVTVPAAASVTLTFVTSYWVALAVQGPGTISGTSVWAHAGSIFADTATPNAGAQFDGWSGTGAGAYTGNGSELAVTVSGPISEVATFTTAPAAATPTTNFWATGAGIGLLAVAGIVVGLAVAVAVSRRRPREPPAEWTGESGGTP
jgi:Divergent InlB B-repeat domain